MQYSTETQMKNEPVLVRHFSLNQQALRAQEFLRNEGVEAFIFMDATWSGDGETKQGIRLVVKPSDSDLAHALLHTYDQREEEAASKTMHKQKKESGFFIQAAWLVSILFAFLLGSFLTDSHLDGTEIAVGAVFMIAAIYFFFAANMQKKKVHA